MLFFSLFCLSAAQYYVTTTYSTANCTVGTEVRLQYAVVPKGAVCVASACSSMQATTCPITPPLPPNPFGFVYLNDYDPTIGIPCSYYPVQSLAWKLNSCVNSNNYTCSSTALTTAQFGNPSCTGSSSVSSQPLGCLPSNSATVCEVCPTTISAGSPQNVSSSSASLVGTLSVFPLWFIGTWTVVSGSGTFANANAAQTTVSSLSVGDNIFRWTIPYPAPCLSQTSTVRISRKSASSLMAFSAALLVLVLLL